MEGLWGHSKCFILCQGDVRRGGFHEDLKGDEGSSPYCRRRAESTPEERCFHETS